MGFPADSLAKGQKRSINTDAPPPLEAPYTQSNPSNDDIIIERPEHIDEDGVYYYNTDTEDDHKDYDTISENADAIQYKITTPPEDTNLFFRGGIFGPFEITNPKTGATYSQTFNDGEQKASMVFLLEYEWKVIKWLGDLGLKVGTGFSSSSGGKGRFVDPINAGKEPQESYDLFIFPTTAVVTYHMRIGDTPWLVPYIQGGGGYFGFWEKRSDGGSNKFGGAPVLTAGGGLLISMSAFDQDVALTLYSDYGITRFWLDLQFQQVFAIDEFKDFTSNMITGGIGLGF